MPYADPQKRRECQRSYRERNAERERLRKAAWLRNNRSKQAARLRRWRRERAAQDAAAALEALRGGQ